MHLAYARDASLIRNILKMIKQVNKQQLISKKREREREREREGEECGKRKKKKAAKREMSQQDDMPI